MSAYKGVGATPAKGETIQEVFARQIARRTILKGALAFPVLGLAPSFLLPRDGQGAEVDQLEFRPVSLNTEDAISVPSGYKAQVLIRWGEPLFPNAPDFDLKNQTAEAQSKQFGYNCDYVAFFPFDRGNGGNSKRGILAVNHEYTNPEIMFPDYNPAAVTKTQVDVQIAAHGLGLVEVEFARGEWRFNRRSRYNRRITGETEMQLTGPAAGSELLKSSYDPTGKRVRGTFNNCGGGVTPWGTVLTAEENFNQYFANRNSLPDSDARKAIHARYGLPAENSERRWERFHDRFDLEKDPNEPFRFGWVVEIDPYDPNFVPKKRTALGRLKHEAATVVVAPDRRVAVYTGDDERFDYVYKFVSKRPMSKRRQDNFALLDEGTLYVAKFDVDSNGKGIGEWISLKAGEGPLSNWSESMVLINTRGAADLVGATKMDRPEDIETNPVTGKVYVVCTHNNQRGTEGKPGVDAANPIPKNIHGHIIELTEDKNNHASTKFTWEMFMRCGEGLKSSTDAYFAGYDPRKCSTISCPDNIIFDRRGNLWIATDGQPNSLKKNDGIYAVPVQGSDRGFVRQFLSGVAGAEVASLDMTPDNHTLFASIQHPGEGSKNLDPANLLSRWPDGDFPRPSVVAVYKSEWKPFIGG